LQSSSHPASSTHLILCVFTMAPRSGFSPSNAALTAARRGRKRQSRRTGISRKGCQTVCNWVGACPLVAFIDSEDVLARKQDLEDTPEGAADVTKNIEINLNRKDESGLQLPGGMAAIEACISSQGTQNSGDRLCQEDVQIPVLPSIHATRRVRFDMSATVIHEVTAYAEIYGAHPREFVFDKDSQMIAAARGGFVSAGFTIPTDDELDCDSEEECSEDDGDWESWLLEQESCEDSTEFEKPHRSVQETCLPDLDDEAGWDLWLESTLGRSQEEFCDDCFIE